MRKRKILTFLGLVLIIISLGFGLRPLFLPKLLFSPTFPSLASLPPNSPTPPNPPTTLMAVGDVMLGRQVNVQMLKYKDFKYPFLKTADLLSKADVTFGNLESPIIKNCRTTSVGMVFCGREEALEGLKFAGFDVLSIANNHILNHGPQGREQTINFLTQNSILASDSNITIKQFNNLKFGFLSYDLVSNPQISPISQIAQIVPTVDILLVSLHWGVEYEKEPRQWQKNLAQAIIDAGAKVVIGHHPHVTQPSEKYKDGLIFYSLGNFVFDQPWSEETKSGKIAKIIFAGKEIKSFEEIPVYIKDYCQPDFPPSRVIIKNSKQIRLANKLFNVPQWFLHPVCLWPNEFFCPNNAGLDHFYQAKTLVKNRLA